MKWFFVFPLTMFIAWNACAATPTELEREFRGMLQYCAKVGFHRCEGKFQGKNRGVFNIPIEAQKLKITEEEFDQFVRKTYENDVSVSFFPLVADYKLDVSDQFSIALFSEITGMQEMNKEGTIIEIKFKRAPRVALAKVGNEYKIGIFPEEHNEFIKSKSYGYAHLLRLKNNILQYHMKEAQILKYDQTTLRENVSHALAPAVLKISGDKFPKAYNKFLRRDFGEVQRFYMPLNSPELILQKIRETHPERKL